MLLAVALSLAAVLIVGVCIIIICISRDRQKKKPFFPLITVNDIYEVHRSTFQRETIFHFKVVLVLYVKMCTFS